ncbi:hypothetical protein OROMI_014082 [Orobanche minor]
MRCIDVADNVCPYRFSSPLFLISSHLNLDFLRRYVLPDQDSCPHYKKLYYPFGSDINLKVAITCILNQW